MQNLDLEWEDPLFRYTQVERHSTLALYTQTHKFSGTVRYEVIKIQVHKPRTWPSGRFTPLREGYPSSSQWGDDGWTFFSLTAAQAKLHELHTAPSET